MKTNLANLQGEKKYTLTLLHSEKPKMDTILAFLSTIGLTSDASTHVMLILKIQCDRKQKGL